MSATQGMVGLHPNWESNGDWITVPKSSVTGLLSQNVDSKHM